MSLKPYLPWWFKIFAKIMMSRLPFPYRSWKRLGLFEHGYMQSLTYAHKVFSQHFERVNLEPGFISLELGPGDSILSAILSKAAGGAQSYLVDSGDFATHDTRTYQEMEAFLQVKGLLDPALANDASLDEICRIYSAKYLTEGLKSLKRLPSQSIDFIWSQAVLEHVRKEEFFDTMQELRRIIHANGICSHVIDLKDHLGGALNNLRFSDQLWESNFMARSGFYTNRIRYSEMVEFFKEAGFSVEVVDLRKWQTLPTSRSNMSSEFKYLPDDELCISGFTVLLKPC